MRTKTLLLTAALSAAGIATSMAQAPVYSVNAVGYVNTALVKGFNLIANPLNNTATGGNKIKSLFATLPDGSQIFRFNTTTAKYDLASVDFGEVSGTIADQDLLPGEGVFVNSNGAVTLTFVGEVPTGTDLPNQVPKGLSIRSSVVPQAGKITTDLLYPATDGDQVFSFNETTQKYTTSGFDFGAWDSEPTLDVGKAVFINSAAPKNWKRTFSVSQ
jgi:hypothetical protein